MEEANTEQKQKNNDISLNNIYRGIGYLKPEQQSIILTTYKITELYSILANHEEYEKYIASLINTATTYVNTVGALIDLRKEAVKESKANSESKLLDAINQAYDSSTKEGKETFCQEMLGKKDFFENAYRMIMDCFENALKEKGDVADGVVDVAEK